MAITSTRIFLEKTNLVIESSGQSRLEIPMNKPFEVCRKTADFPLDFVSNTERLELLAFNQTLLTRFKRLIHNISRRLRSAFVAR